MFRRTTRHVTGLLLVFAVLSDTAGTARAQGHAPAGPAPALKETIDSLLVREMRSRRIPGLAVAVLDHGVTTFVGAYGSANLEVDAALKPTSVFELASITKQFTAAAIMMLVEEGKVRLDDPIAAYVEGSPEGWRAITVRHLLTHTSGLPVDAIVFAEGSPLLNVSTRTAFDFASRAPLLFPAGTRASYSDVGYFLLGMVIERASGQSYREFMQRRLFDPLGMERTSVIDRSRVLKDRVSVYTLRNGELANWRRDWQYELPSFFGILSTLEDLARWDAALRSGPLLGRTSLDAMWTPARLGDGRDARVGGSLYGFGWELGYLRGHRTVSHSGASGTFILRFLDEPVTVIVLTNLDVRSGANAPALARRVAELVRPEYASPLALPERPDPSPSTTAVLRTLLADLAAQRASPVMTPGNRAYYEALPPPARQQLATQLSGMQRLTFLAGDTVRNPWRGAEPTARVAHYRAEADGRPLLLSFELTGDGHVVTLQLTPALRR